MVVVVMVTEELAVTRPVIDSVHGSGRIRVTRDQHCGAYHGAHHFHYQSYVYMSLHRC